MRHLFVFVHLVNRTEYLVRIRSLTKRTNINEPPAKQFTNCSLNIRSIFTPIDGNYCF
ncbi:hypothetical protein Hanom_Chr11g00981531 [Helianthus anomalus]